MKEKEQKNKLENVSEYIYLEQLGEENQVAKLHKRISMTWAEFEKINSIFNNKDIPIVQKVYKQTKSNVSEPK